MAKISESVTIDAKREAVFDLISRVEEFPLYADSLKEVEKIGYRRYRWVARIHGFTLSWDSRITEFHRPDRLAWRSIRGFENSGEYKLTKKPSGTKVELSIEYKFDGLPLAGLMEALVTPVTRAAAAAILEKVKRRLEQNDPFLLAKKDTLLRQQSFHARIKRPHGNSHA